MSHRDHKRAIGGWRRLTAAVAVGVALLLAARAALPPAPARAQGAAPASAFDSSEEFGVNTGVMFNGGHYSRVQIDAQLAALARTGASVVRSDALWEDAEPQAPLGILHYHRYNWTLDDLIVSSLAAHGLRWLPIIDYAAPWARAARNQLHSPPSSIADYAAYAGAVASRYGPGGSFWLEHPSVKPLPVLTYEIWNEPDNPTFWSPSPNPGAYATLYSAARGAIRSKEAGAQVIIGGLMRPAWFLAGMLAVDPGLRGQIDGVAIHPYGSTPDRVFVGVRDARLAMSSDGLATVPLYVTEVGWTTHGTRVQDSATAAERPGYISETVTTLAHNDCGIAAVMLYAWTTPQRNPANPQDWFGISPPGGGSSPDAAAFTAALQAAEMPAPPALLCTTTPALIDTRVLPQVVRKRSARVRVMPRRKQHRKPRRTTKRRA